MISQNPRLEIYDPKTLAVMDKAFHAVWQVLTTVTPSAIMPMIANLECHWAQADGAGGERGNPSRSAWIPRSKEPASATH